VKQKNSGEENVTSAKVANNTDEATPQYAFR